MNKKTTNEIHHQILNIYLKYLYIKNDEISIEYKD